MSSSFSVDKKINDQFHRNAKIQKIVSKEVVEQINTELKAKGLKGEIKISETVGSFRGGFVLEKGGVEVNNTFEALVDSLKDELEFEVAQVLFN